MFTMWFQGWDPNNAGKDSYELALETLKKELASAGILLLSSFASFLFPLFLITPLSPPPSSSFSFSSSNICAIAPSNSLKASVKAGRIESVERDVRDAMKDFDAGGQTFSYALLRRDLPGKVISISLLPSLITPSPSFLYSFSSPSFSFLLVLLFLLLPPLPPSILF